MITKEHFVGSAFAVVVGLILWLFTSVIPTYLSNQSLSAVIEYGNMVRSDVNYKEYDYPERSLKLKTILDKLEGSKDGEINFLNKLSTYKSRLESSGINFYAFDENIKSIIETLNNSAKIEYRDVLFLESHNNRYKSNSHYLEYLNKVAYSKCIARIRLINDTDKRLAKIEINGGSSAFYLSDDGGFMKTEKDGVLKIDKIDADDELVLFSYLNGSCSSLGYFEKIKIFQDGRLSDITEKIYPKGYLNTINNNYSITKFLLWFFFFLLFLFFGTQLASFIEGKYSTNLTKPKTDEKS